MFIWLLSDVDIHISLMIFLSHFLASRYNGISFAITAYKIESEMMTYNMTQALVHLLTFVHFCCDIWEHLKFKTSCLSAIFQDKIFIRIKDIRERLKKRNQFLVSSFPPYLIIIHMNYQTNFVLDCLNLTTKQRLVKKNNFFHFEKYSKLFMECLKRNHTS